MSNYEPAIRDLALSKHDEPYLMIALLELLSISETMLPHVGGPCPATVDFNDVGLLDSTAFEGGDVVAHFLSSFYNCRKYLGQIAADYPLEYDLGFSLLEAIAAAGFWRKASGRPVAQDELDTLVDVVAAARARLLQGRIDFKEFCASHPQQIKEAAPPAKTQRFTPSIDLNFWLKTSEKIIVDSRSEKPSGNRAAAEKVEVVS